MKNAPSFALKFLVVIAIATISSNAHAQSKKKAEMSKGMAGKMTKKMSAGEMAETMQVSRAYLNNNNIPSSGVALEGYCPVAYFAANKPLMGKPEFASDFKGVTYYFVSADAKAMFDKEPQKFIPAYGGWCALGMAVGDKFPVDPKTFKIVDGKLHLFLKNKNVDALDLWNKGNADEYVEKAAAHWAKVNK